jgi:hypothetical protein
MKSGGTLLSIVRLIILFFKLCTVTPAKFDSRVVFCCAEAMTNFFHDVFQVVLIPRVMLNPPPTGGRPLGSLGLPRAIHIFSSARKKRPTI